MQMQASANNITHTEERIKMKKNLQITLAVALLCSAGSVLAEDYNPSWYVGGSVSGVATDRDFDAGHRGYGGSLRLGKPIAEYWDLQFSGSYIRAKEQDRRYRQKLLDLDVLFLFSRKAIRPYIVFGAGLEHDKTTNNLGTGARRNSFGINGGVGVQVDFSDQWSLQTDIRQQHGYLNNQDFGFHQASNTFLNVGLNYAFDKPVVQARPVVRAPEPAPVAAYVPPAPAPAPIAAPAPPRFEKITLSAMELFGFDSAVLGLPQPKLDEIATALNNNAQVDNITITGYADRLGSAKYNQNLSEQRANSVKNYLQDKGVNPSRMLAQGKGESDPVVTCTDKKRADLIKCLEPNRRVEIDQITIERRVP